MNENDVLFQKVTRSLENITSINISDTCYAQGGLQPLGVQDQGLASQEIPPAANLELKDLRQSVRET